MAREPTQPLDPDAQELIRTRFEEIGISRAELARRAGVNRSVVTRVLDPRRRQQSVSIRALNGISRSLGLASDVVVQQYEFELEITDEFIAAAGAALNQELLRLRQHIGRIRAHRITALVGVEIHGLAPEKQVFERVFALPTNAAARRPR
jgi:transcriptional regulator with XRE-family HTH domain